MTIATTEAVKLPFSQQFSPKQTPLAKLLPILRANAGKPSLTNALTSAFHTGKNDPTGLASNTVYSLRSWGILGKNDSLSDFGKDLIATQGDDSKGHRLLASRFLLTLNGVHLVEALREMKEAGRLIDLRTLAAEMETRGVQVSKSSSDLSGALGWLRSAGVVTGQYGVSDDTYRAVCGASIASLNALRGLTPEQIAFLRAMLALNVKDFTSFSEIVRHAEGLYAGEVRFNWKEIPGTVLHALESTGLIAYQKQSKKGLDTPEGRGGKSGLVKPTAKFEAEIAEPLLKLMFGTARFAVIREIRRRSLADIVKDLASQDANKSGKALEFLAVQLCMLLDLDFLDWRTTDREVAAGGEVDALLHSARLIYSRWQVQCKVGQITLETVAKEVGMQSVTLANVVLVVSNGKITESAKAYREHISRTSHLNIIYIDGPALHRIIKDPKALIDVLQAQAREALSLKPKPGFKADESKTANPAISVSANESVDSAEEASAQPEQTLPEAAYETPHGAMYCGDSLTILPSLIDAGYRARLILTSPPFALVRKKAYGNEDSDDYIEWFAQFIPLFKQLRYFDCAKTDSTLPKIFTIIIPRSFRLLLSGSRFAECALKMQ